MVKKTKLRSVIRYCDENGFEPFTEWIVGLRDVPTRQRILRRVDRMESGNFGDFKVLKDGVFELRLDFRSGYRVYFAEDNGDVVLLLVGGDKSTQNKDIEKAKTYWKDYKDNG